MFSGKYPWILNKISRILLVIFKNDGVKVENDGVQKVFALQHQNKELLP